MASGVSDDAAVDATVEDGAAPRDDGGAPALALPEVLVGVDLTDPAPVVATNTAGELPSSGLRVVLEWYQNNYPTDLTVHELDSQASFAAGKGDFYEVPAQTGSAVFLSGADASAKNALGIMRLTQAGFVPRTPVAGYTEVAGNFYSEGAMLDGRFHLFVRRTSNSKGVEVVDVARGRRHGHVVDDVFGSGQYVDLAPRGSYFTMLWSKTEDQTVTSRSGWAKITESGVTPRVALPDDARNATFSGDGQYLYYLRGNNPHTVGSPLSPFTLHGIALPNGARAQPALAPELKLTGRLLAAPGANMFVQATLADSANLVWYEVEPSGKATLVTDAAQSSSSVWFAGPHTFISYEDGTTTRLALREAGTTRVLGAMASSEKRWYVPLTAPRHILFSKDDDALHALAFEGDTVHDVIIGAPPERSMYNCAALHDDLFTFRTADGSHVFVSLAQPVARRLGTIAAAGTTALPPCLMRHPSKPLFLSVRQTASKLQLWVVEATGTSLGTPVLERELDLMTGATFRVLLFGG